MVTLKFLVLSVGVQIPVSLPNSLKPPSRRVAFFIIHWHFAEKVLPVY